MTTDATPLLHDPESASARPSLLGSDKFSEKQQRVDERIRTLCLVILSVAVLGVGAYYLRPILVRFVLALALKYLLTPLIDLLSCQASSCKYKLPRGLATIIALLIAAGALTLLAIVMAKCIGSFAAHADQYADRAQTLLDMALNATAKFDIIPGDLMQNRTGTEGLKNAVATLAKTNLNLKSLIVAMLGTAALAVENIVYILLFLAFLLAGSEPRRPVYDGDVHAAAEEQIYLYIRGKVGIALLVASCDALILSTIGVSLWLVFAIVTFWLVFIPNIGLAVSLFLPMPIVLLDPHFGIVGVVLAFAGPLAVGLVAKDVLEPLVLGHSTSLTPVAVLLAVMLWATVWGITGMVLAVPLTAVIRIYLQGLDHPLAKFVANVLAGKESGNKSVAPL